MWDFSQWVVGFCERNLTLTKTFSISRFYSNFIFVLTISIILEFDLDFQGLDTSVGFDSTHFSWKTLLVFIKLGSIFWSCSKMYAITRYDCVWNIMNSFRFVFSFFTRKKHRRKNRVLTKTFSLALQFLHLPWIFNAKKRCWKFVCNF